MTTMKFVIFSFFVLGYGLCVSQEVEDSSPRVTTSLGVIEGYYKTSYGGERFEAYEGLPYVQPPIGEYRFRVAKAISPWTGVRMAKKFGRQCVQYASNNVTGSEDCLYMNIYTKNIDDDDTWWFGKSRKLLPVIFFIHGGFFQIGSGSLYGPKYLLDRDVVLVTINYRLGPMGFLSTEDEVVPGNMGLKDQVMALRFVKENIKSFGGDPSRVTIFGQSAGGASVHYHILSKLSSGLFQRGMSLSGTALDPWALTQGCLVKAKKLASDVNCPFDKVPRMVQCLRSRPANQILQAVGEFQVSFLHNAPPTPFGPVVEKGHGDFVMIDRSPMKMITSGPSAQDVPWIAGEVRAEGLTSASDIVTRKKLQDALNRNWDKLVPYLLDFNYTIPKTDQTKVAELIRKHYLEDQPIDKSTVNQIIRMIGDRTFIYGIERAARSQALVNASPVRFYYFTYIGAHSTSHVSNGIRKKIGVSHGDDLALVLDSFFDPTTTAEDREMQKVMINLWVSFATDGTPDVGVKWPRLSRIKTKEYSYLNIAGPEDVTVMKRSRNFGEGQFWRRINSREKTV